MTANWPPRPGCSPPNWPGWSGLTPQLPAEEAAAGAGRARRQPPGLPGLPARRSRHLAQARAEAGRRRPDLVATLDRLTARLRDPADELAVRFGQYTGAVQAKGVEDTAYYRWSRFVALNEVGGAPQRFGRTPAQFHRAAARRAERRPAGMTTLATHDTKRGEDVRARLAVLSEIPGTGPRRRAGGCARAALPDPAFTHLLWQTAVGAWPIARDRLHAYATKAAREAATTTTWTDPDPAYEARPARPRRRHVRRRRPARRTERARRADHPRRLEQLAGPEADPAHDARGPRRLPGHGAVGRLPGRPRQPPPGRLRAPPRSAGPPRRRLAAPGRRRAARRSCWSSPGPPGCAATGRSSSPATGRCAAQGPAAGHAVAFDRGGAITVATRLPLRLAARGGWGDTAHHRRQWRHRLTDVLTGRRHRGGVVPLAELLDRYPVALLVRPGGQR